MKRAQPRSSSTREPILPRIGHSIRAPIATPIRLSGQLSRWLSVVSLLTFVCLSGSVSAQDFTYNPAGTLTPGSGDGASGATVYIPGMRFPIEVAPAYLNSQVWGNGGSQGPGGSQCDAVNYSYPWWDNYCESRSWDMPLCPSGTGHQGQDMRASTCENNTHWTTAAEAGTITDIGSYSVWLTTDDGTLHRYLHMDPASVLVDIGDDVTQGERLGRVSNAFGDSSTTIHLHYDVAMNVDDVGFVYVSPYMSLVRSYETLIGETGQSNSCDSLAAEETVLDNDSPCFFLHGPAATWRYVDSAGYEGDLYWSYTWENDASNWAEWVLEFDVAGEYEVEVYITSDYAQSVTTRYSVTDSSGTNDLSVDQSSGDGWLSIGTFDFRAGVPQGVAVYDGPGEASALQRQFIADALRVTPTFDVGPGDDTGVADVGGGEDVGTTDAGLDLGAPDVTLDTNVADTGPGNNDTSAPDDGLVAVTVNDEGCSCALATGPQLRWFPVLAVLAVLIRSRRRR